MKDITTTIREGFYKNTGTNITNFYKHATHISINNHYHPDWDNRFRIDINSNGEMILCDGYTIGHIDLLNSEVFRRIAERFKSSQVKYKFEPDPGILSFRLWADKFYLHIAFHSDLGSIYYMEMRNYDLLDIDAKEYHSKGYSTGGDTSDCIYDMTLIDKYIGYKRIKLGYKKMY